MQPFIHKLGDEATLKASGESGTITGRAEHLAGEPQYLVLYKAADGRQIQCWWDQSALQSPESLDS